MPPQRTDLGSLQPFLLLPYFVKLKTAIFATKLPAMLTLNRTLLFLFAAFIIALTAACNKTAVKNNAANTPDAKGYLYFGSKITDQGITPLADVLNKLEAENLTELPAKVSGTVTGVCQVKGCWMTLQTPSGTDMRVSFKDYGFFMPKDISGKTVIIEGKAQKVTTSVDDLRHYAEDAGKSADEIAQITQPEVEITFVADGVILK